MSAFVRGSFGVVQSWLMGRLHPVAYAAQFRACEYCGRRSHRDDMVLIAGQGQFCNARCADEAWMFWQI